MGLVVANPDDITRPVNSPKTRYQINASLLKVIRTYGTSEWDTNLRVYLKNAQELRRLHEKEREMALIPVKLPNGREVRITAGGQNALIKQIIEEFCPRFTPGGLVIYVGDAGDKFRVYEPD
jgi:adenine-specific DNA-methyltransferase